MKTKNVTEKNMKVCLVGSSGGHLTHLYMLKPFWKDKNHFWVTFDTLNGTLYPDEQVVIYDIGDVKPETEKKRRGRRKKSEIEAEQKEN